jgi:ferritin-like metal-binding protein YciE
MLDLKPSGKECYAIKGIIQEGDELIAEKPAQAALDAGLLAAAQAVEHYEMARYGTLRAWADQLGYAAAAKLLEQTLSEEKSADAQLTVLALSSVNAEADSGKPTAKADKGNLTKSDIQRERAPNHSR